MDRRFVAALFGAGFLFCWVMTSASHLAFVNWDNGAFLSAMGSVNERWSNWAPWNAHFAIQNVYWPGIWIVQPFGGTLIDGFRLATQRLSRPGRGGDRRGRRAACRARDSSARCWRFCG